MKRFSSALNQEQLELLRSLLNKAVAWVYSPQLVVMGGIALSRAMQIDAGSGRFLHITFSNAETPVESLDHGLLTIDLTDRAGNSEGVEPVLLGDTSAVQVDPPIHISRIDVLQRAEDGDHESVVFDAGFVLVGSDGHRLYIGVAEMLEGCVCMLQDGPELEQLLGGTTTTSQTQGDSWRTINNPDPG